MKLIVCGLFIELKGNNMQKGRPLECGSVAGHGFSQKRIGGWLLLRVGAWRDACGAQR